MIVATRPTTRPSASIRCYFFSTSAGLADLVVFISAFMGVLFSNEKSGTKGAAVGGANCGWPPESQGNPVGFRRVKSYPEALLSLPKRMERRCAAHRFTFKTKHEERVMYIGLGGLLILILILWLLGVI